MTATRLRRRHAAERRFRFAARAAVWVSLGFLAWLLLTMTAQGLGGLGATFLTASDSTDAAGVGIWGALKGSLLTMAVTLALDVPVGTKT